MDGFNGEGNGLEFNVGTSGNGSEFDVAGYDNISDYYDARRTRNLFSLAPPGSGSGAYNSYTSVPHPLSSSTIPSPGQLRMSGLNVNASEGWPHIDAYEGILCSGDQVGGIGSSRGPPPVRVPASSGGVHTAPVHRQRRAASRSRGARRRGAGHAVAGDNNPPVSNEITRAKWNKDDTKKFCEIYCTQIDLGNYKNGNMTKWGWKDVQDRF